MSCEVALPPQKLHNQNPEQTKEETFNDDPEVAAVAERMAA